MFNFKNSNSGKTRIKLLATLLVLTLTFANFSLLGSYIGQVIATEIDLNRQDNSTNSDNVKFELYFDTTDKSQNEISRDINSKALLYASVNLKSGGVLKDAKIELTDTNFELQESVNKQSLNLDTIQAETGITLELPIQFKKDSDVFNLGLLDMISKITLTGEYTNNEGEIVEINSTKYVKVNWTSEEIEEISNEEELPIELSQQLITNKIYNIEGTNKRVIQYKITSGITDNKYPIKQTAIELQVPKYDETTKQILTKEQIVDGVNAIAPEKVSVAAYSLKATNQNQILSFNECQEISENNIGFVYNEQEGKVNINVINQADENNKIAWITEGKDEFIVTYIYPQDIQVSAIESIVNSKIALHDLNNRILTKEITNTQTNPQEIGDIITFETSANNALYKSNMYIGQETLYNTRWTAKISCANIAESIKVTNASDKLKIEETEEQTEQEIEANSYYKNTYINKQELDYILGAQGSLRIYNGANLDTPIAEINSQTEASDDRFITIENGNLAINYQTAVEKIVIEILNPEKAGLLNIYNQKAIKTNAEEISNIKAVDVSARLFAMQGETEIVKEKTRKNTIKLLEPVSEAEFGISKTEFSSINENDLNFTVTLKTDDIKYDLYENPVITIALPEVVANVAVTEEDVTILNSNELKLDKLEEENNQIRLTLSGKQTKYASTNTQISINAKLKTQKLIPTIAKDIVMTVKNGKATVYPNNGETVIKTQTVNFEAEQGMLLATSVSNYNNENKTITAFEENKTGILEIGKEARIATVKGTVINNTKTDLEEIKIFGKVQNSGTSINTTLNAEIAVTKAFGENANLETAIYYTEDTNPSLESNWVNTSTANTTAYLIVCKNFAKATVVEFSYQVAIPQNLTTNKNAEISYEVYNNNQKIVAPQVKLETPKEVKLNLDLTASVQNGQEVYEGQNIVYNIKVTNTGEVDAENVKINSQISEGLTVVEGQTEIEGLNIKAGETIEKQINATVKEGATQVSFSAEAKTDYLIQEAKAAITNTVAKAEIELKIDKEIFTYSELAGMAQIGSEIRYRVRVKNTSNKDMNNIQIIDKLPEELNFKELYIYKILGEESTRLELNNIYNQQTKEINVQIDNLKAGEQALISIYTNVNKVVDSNIINSVYVTASEEYPDVTFNSTDTIKVIGAPNVTSSITSNAGGNLEAGDIIEYTIKVKNDGETTEYITIEDGIPEALDIQSAYYSYKEGEQKEAAINLNSVSLNSMELKQNQELTLKIKTKVKEIELNTTIENYAIITGRFTNQTTEIIRNTIVGTGNKPSDSPNENPSENPNENPEGSIDSTYSISGIAWQDDNTNGVRENEEKLLSDIVVKIINAESNEYLLNEQGIELQQVTNENGTYEFANLKPGKYIVVFDYNKKTYGLTTYQKADIESTINSDARLVTEENNNITKTDILEITNKDISNIDIGLILNPIFDLKLDKYITKVTVQNEQGTKVYEYDKTQLAKVEIPAKMLDGSVIIIEYQMDVTNEGEVPAHVDTIVDYVSPQFEFISELNTSWYQGDDKNLYCIEFANEDLQPGETRETKLVLTKTMTNDNTGLVNNAAEIYETFNEYAFEDLDSTPANKAEEDDLSEADIIISVKTGGPLLYIGIVIISMTILLAGIYLINKKVIKNHII